MIQAFWAVYYQLGTKLQATLHSSQVQNISGLMLFAKHWEAFAKHWEAFAKHWEAFAKHWESKRKYDFGTCYWDASDLYQNQKPS
jgi:hypothetical protein